MVGCVLFLCFVFVVMTRRPTRSTRTDTLCHYTTRFRSVQQPFNDHIIASPTHTEHSNSNHLLRLQLRELGLDRTPCSEVVGSFRRVDGSVPKHGRAHV